MYKSGLVSISFRNLDVAQIIEQVSQAGLEAIEWGGDIHVPHGDFEKANLVYKMCNDKGILCPSYGSYYIAGESPEELFDGVLGNAQILKSERIRVWAGSKGSNEADKNYFNRVVKDLKRICKLSANEGKSIGLEFHGNTLTDDAHVTKKLLDLVDENNLSTYWQPPVDRELEDNILDIKLLKQKISNVHVFTWKGIERKPLEEGYSKWIKYLKQINDERTHYCLLEFVINDSIEQFKIDAAILKKMLEEFDNEQ